MKCQYINKKRVERRKEGEKRRKKLTEVRKEGIIVYVDM